MPTLPTNSSESALVTLRLHRALNRADHQAVLDFVAAMDCSIVESALGRHSITVRATLDRLGRAFGVEMIRLRDPAGEYRSYTGSIRLPAALACAVEVVLGLDERPQLRRKLARTPRHFDECTVTNAGFTPLQLAARYDFPDALDGSGQCIGIIALGGGYDPADLQAYFSTLGIPAPRVELVTVDGAANLPGTAPDCDAEVLLDIEIAGSVAPGAVVAVYLAPDTDQGFLHALEAAVHDSVNRPSIISISLGQPEYTWSQPLLAAFDALLREAARMGITVCCASGDAGSSAGLSDGRAHVEFPASSPWVLACGGTRLQAGPEANLETVWNELAAGKGASGGGISDVYDVPQWQTSANIPVSANAGARRGRGVPDVAANADPSSGYRVRISGRNVVAGGTSAATPLWAGLCARINQHLGGRIGFINPALYEAALRTNALVAVTEGNNGAYSARSGWSACTGLGSPRGRDLLATLAQMKASR